MKVRNKIVTAIAFVLLLLVPVFLISSSSGAQSASDSWSMFHHDASHTGSSDTAAPKTNQTLWKFNTGGQMGSPTVADGVVFVGSYDRKIYALNAAHGSVEWSFQTGDQVVSSSAVANGIVYFGSYDRIIYALGSSEAPQMSTFNPAQLILLITLIAIIAIAVAAVVVKKEKDRRQ